MTYELPVPVAVPNTALMCIKTDISSPKTVVKGSDYEYESQGCGFRVPLGARIFHFVFFRFSLVHRILAESIQIKSITTFFRCDRCIERMIIFKKYDAGTSH